MPELVVVITHEAGLAEDIVAAWTERGVPRWASFDARTPVVDKVPLSQVSQDDMPLIPSLRKLLTPDVADGRVLFCIVSDELEKVAATVAVTDMAGESTLMGRGILFTVPVGSVPGLPL